MSDKRIIEYDTATELSDDDYLVLDSESGGTCKILAKKLEPVKPEYITAVYTQSGTVYDTDELDVLIPDLVVTAYYEDGTVEHNVSGYILSGELTVGESTITCTYKSKSATFTVTVSSSITYLYNWDFTESLTDNVQGVTATLSGSATRDSNGVSISGASGYLKADISSLIFYGNTIEIDFSATDFQPTRGDIFCVNMGSTQYSTGIRFNENNMWVSRKNGSSQSVSQTSNNANLFNGKTFKMYMQSDDRLYIYADEDLVLVLGSFLLPTDTVNNFTLGYSSNAYYNMTITGVRIYANQ